VTCMFDFQTLQSTQKVFDSIVDNIKEYYVSRRLKVNIVSYYLIFVPKFVTKNMCRETRAPVMYYAHKNIYVNNFSSLQSFCHRFTSSNSLYNFRGHTVSYYTNVFIIKGLTVRWSWKQNQHFIIILIMCVVIR